MVLNGETFCGQFNWNDFKNGIESCYIKEAMTLTLIKRFARLTKLIQCGQTLLFAIRRNRSTEYITEPNEIECNGP